MSDRVVQLQNSERVVSGGDLPALAKKREDGREDEKGSTVSVRTPKAGLLEKYMRRFGSWGKRFAFVGYVNQFLGKRALHESMTLYAVATWVSVTKILYDHQEPYGSRNYIANLAGDDEAIYLLRHKRVSIPWEECRKAFLKEKQTWLNKSLQCGVWVVDRNRYTLSLFWFYTVFWRTIGYVGGSNKQARNLFQAVFPRGVPEFVFGCARTSMLLFLFGFSFWGCIGIASENRITSSGLTRTMTTNFVTLSAIMGAVTENTHRWQSLAAFMLMSIVD